MNVVSLFKEARPPPPLYTSLIDFQVQCNSLSPLSHLVRLQSALLLLIKEREKRTFSFICVLSVGREGRRGAILIQQQIVATHYEYTRRDYINYWGNSIKLTLTLGPPIRSASAHTLSERNALLLRLESATDASLSSRQLHIAYSIGTTELVNTVNNDVCTGERTNEWRWIKHFFPQQSAVIDGKMCTVKQTK
jgi:hypothetical protein